MNANTSQSRVGYRDITPEWTIRLLDAIDSCAADERQNGEPLEGADRTAVVTLIRGEYEMTAEVCERLIDSAVNNGLIEMSGHNEGIRLVIRDGSRIERLTHDWYCFECHSMWKQQIDEPLIACHTCWRVFHVRLECRQKGVMSVSESVDGDQHIDPVQRYSCEYCPKESKAEAIDALNGMDAKRLNRLLYYALNRCEHYVNRVFEKFSFESNAYIYSNAVMFESFDLKSMRAKCVDESYASVAQFENDFYRFCHNFLVSSGVFNKSLNLDFEKVRKRLPLELNDLRLCVDCFQYANDAEFDDVELPFDWFCQVCAAPHELVFARVKYRSYWPAKVVARRPDMTYEVRFFEPPKFMRAYVAVDQLKPITHEFPDKYLSKPGMKMALELVLRHVELLGSKGFRLEAVITDSSISCSDFQALLALRLDRIGRKRGNNDNIGSNGEETRHSLDESIEDDFE